MERDYGGARARLLVRRSGIARHSGRCLRKPFQRATPQTEPGPAILLHLRGVSAEDLAAILDHRQGDHMRKPGSSSMGARWRTLACRAAAVSRSLAHGVEPAGHLATEKGGVQKLRGQKRIEMKY